MPSFLLLFTMLGFFVFSNATIDETFTECCLGIGLKPSTAKDSCKYPPNAKLTWGQQYDITRHFSGYMGCYAVHRNNTDCCLEGGVKGSCLNVCNGANPPTVPSPAYMNCKQYGSINDCNQKAAEAKLQLELEAKMTKSLDQKHVGMGIKDNVKHLEHHHFVVQQA